MTTSAPCRFFGFEGVPPIPMIWVSRETTSTSKPRLAPCSTTVFLKPVSTQDLDIVG